MSNYINFFSIAQKSVNISRSVRHKALHAKKSNEKIALIYYLITIYYFQLQAIIETLVSYIERVRALGLRRWHCNDGCLYDSLLSLTPAAVVGCCVRLW